MSIAFTKMHGLGNDYVIIDERDREIIPEDQKADFAREVCDRGSSVGSDGVLYLSTPDNADVQMRIFNADGSEAESCGNGLRCTAYYHHGLHKPGTSEFTINLPLAGVIDAHVEYESGGVADVRLQLDQAGKYIEQREIDVEGTIYNYHYVDVGNPHAVFFLDENEHLKNDLDELNLTELGPKLQNHPDFEDTGGINAEFVVMSGNDTATMRVHERGVGLTAACGTGSIGVARACAKTDRADGWVNVEQPGGTLRIETNKGYLQGPAELSYEGNFDFPG